MNRRLKSVIVSATALLALSPFMAACSSNGSNNASQDQTCFQQMTPAQELQLQQYANQSGGGISSTTSNGNGTQDICVLQPTGNGSYEAHYYGPQDHFGDYLMYSMLAGNAYGAHSIATYGLLSGNLDFSEYLTLQLLTGMSSNGSLYRPYTCSSSYSTSMACSRSSRPVVVNNYRVTQVQYGSRSATRYSTSAIQHAPSGYTTSANRLPRSNGSTATLTRGTNGHGTVIRTAAPKAPTYHNPSGTHTTGAQPKSTRRTSTGTTQKTTTRCCTTRTTTRHR